MEFILFFWVVQMDSSVSIAFLLVAGMFFSVFVGI